jgi:hypothetical protein
MAEPMSAALAAIQVPAGDVLADLVDPRRLQNALTPGAADAPEIALLGIGQVVAPLREVFPDECGESQRQWIFVRELAGFSSLPSQQIHSSPFLSWSCLPISLSPMSQPRPGAATLKRTSRPSRKALAPRGVLPIVRVRAGMNQ